MIYIKTFCADHFVRCCFTMDIVRKRKRTYYVIKQVKGF